MLLDFTFNSQLEVSRSGGTGEVNSLEGLIFVELGTVHQDDRSLSSTSTSNKQGVLQSLLLSDDRSLKRKVGDLVNDILSASRVTGRDQQLREHNLLWGIPHLRCYHGPSLGLRIDNVIENCLLLSNHLLWADGGERGVSFLKDFFVEFDTVFGFKETSHRPGESVDETLLVARSINDSVSLMELLEDSRKQVKELSGSDNFRSGHHVGVLHLDFTE